MQKTHRSAEKKRAAQRDSNKRLFKTIEASIANRCEDLLHELSIGLVKENGAIFVNEVNASEPAKPKMVKSVLESGWSAFRILLKGFVQQSQGKMSMGFCGFYQPAHLRRER